MILDVITATAAAVVVLQYIFNIHFTCSPSPLLNCYRIIPMHKIILIFPVYLPIGTHNILCDERLRVAQYILYCDFCDVSV